MGSKSEKKSAKPAAKGAKDPAARNRKIGIILFVIDGFILSAAVFLFVTVPTCSEELMNDGPYEDYNISGVGSFEIQNWGHETPYFNQFQPSSYGSSSYGSSSPSTSSFWSSIFGGGSSTSDTGSSYSSAYGSGSTYGTGSSGYGYGGSYGSDTTSLGGDSSYGYGTGSTYGSDYGTGSSSYSGSSYGSSYGTGSSSYGTGSSYGSSYGTGSSGYGYGQNYGPDTTSSLGGSSYGSAYGSDSSGSTGYGAGSTYGTGSTYGANYGSGSDSIYGSGSSSPQFGSHYGSGSPDYGTGSSTSGESTYGAGTSTSTSTGTSGSGWDTDYSPGTSPDSGQGLAPGETSSYWTYPPVSPSPSGSSGVGSSFGVAPSPDGASSQITGINAGSGSETGSSGFESPSESPSIGSTSTGGPYPYEHLVDMIPEDRFANTNFPCGVSKTKPNLRPGRVVGGSIAVKHSWPWAVALMRRYEPDAFGNPFFQHMCGGTLVSPRHVVSALHCFNQFAESVDDNEPKGDYRNDRRLFIGKHDNEEITGDEYEFALIRQHPKGIIKPVPMYDLALITTTKEVVFTDTVQPACLPKFKAAKAHGTWCWAYGWGLTKETGGEGFLKQVHLEIGNSQACATSFNFGYLTETYLTSDIAVCAGTEKGQDTCQGDSGGPLTCQEDGKTVLYGATSYGNKCGSGDYAVYASVSYALEWLCCYMAEIPGCQGVGCNPRGYD